MKGEEENAPFRDGFLEEVTLNGDLKKELERSQERLRGKAWQQREPQRQRPSEQ